MVEYIVIYDGPDYMFHGMTRYGLINGAYHNEEVGELNPDARKKLFHWMYSHDFIEEAIKGRPEMRTRAFRRIVK